MRTATTDRLGRATFYSIQAKKDVRPTVREIRWLKHIERHGPQSSEFLFELTRDTHRSKDTALRDMQKLRAGGFLMLPRQQRMTERAEFNPYIYELTKLSTNYLGGLGQSEATFRPTGHWWHAQAVSAVTSSFDILARKQNREYIPAHSVVKSGVSDLAISIGNRRLIPDQFFAVKYQTGYRAFLLEIDRGTEPFRSSAARKTLAKSIDLYTQMFATRAHHSHYGHKASTLSLWVFSEPARLTRFRSVLQERAGTVANHFLAKLLPDSLGWQSLEEFHRAPWLVCDGREVLGL